MLAATHQLGRAPDPAPTGQHRWLRGLHDARAVTAVRVAVALALLLLAGCGGSGGQTPAAAPSSPPGPPPTRTAPTPSASTSPTPDEGDLGLPTDEPTPLSKQAAAKRYLELVEPANEAGKRLDAAIEDRDLKKIPAAAKEYAKVALPSRSGCRRRLGRTRCRSTPSGWPTRTRRISSTRKTSRGPRAFSGPSTCTSIHRHRSQIGRAHPPAAGPAGGPLGTVGVSGRAGAVRFHRVARGRLDAAGRRRAGHARRARARRGVGRGPGRVRPVSLGRPADRGADRHRRVPAARPRAGAGDSRPEVPPVLRRRLLGAGRRGHRPAGAAGGATNPSSPPQSAAARWSTSGDAGQRVLSRKDPRVSPLVAATLALHAMTIPAPIRGAWMVGLP